MTAFQITEWVAPAVLFGTAAMLVAILYVLYLEDRILRRADRAHPHLIRKA